MKLITLNTWGGKVFKSLAEFLKRYSTEVDIFCFQEVFHNAVSVRSVLGDVRPNLFSDFEQILGERFIGSYAASQDDDEGLAIFVRNTIKIEEQRDIFVYRHMNAMEGDDGTTIGRNIQYIQFTQNDKKYIVVNFHGLWTGGDKKDTPERIEQSKQVKKFLNEAPGAKVLCGDFNLLPDTESIVILEEGMRNLIKEHGITSTRSHFYGKEPKFADYIIVSPEIEVKDFRVFQDPVSDHLPLYLDFT